MRYSPNVLELFQALRFIKPTAATIVRLHIEKGGGWRILCGSSPDTDLSDCRGASVVVPGLSEAALRDIAADLIAQSTVSAPA